MQQLGPNFSSLRSNTHVPKPVLKIVELLRATDITMAHTAERMGRSHSLVVSINQRYSVRHYRGRRSNWALG
jgi:hypothetical protein